LNRTEYIQRFSGINKRYEDKYLPKVNKALIPHGFLSAIESHGAHGGMAFLHQTVSNEKLKNVIEDLYLEVGLRYSRMNYTRMQEEKQLKGFGFNEAWTNFIKQYLNRFLIEKITFKVSTTTRDELLAVLQQSITEGWSVDRTVKEIEDLPFLKYQAARIVRTEVGRAANVGSKAQSETFPYEQMKEWISAHDKRVRGVDPEDHASHKGLDGIRINSGDLFQDPRNGDLLDHPGDPRASAESTINCRCTIAYTAKRDANGRLIPKRQSTSVIFPLQNQRRQTVLI
jgi:hypothetical protein